MTLFTPDELVRLLGIVDKNNLLLVAQILGKSALTTADKDALRRWGVNLGKLKETIPPFQQAYLFGRLVASLKDNQLKQISPTDWEKYLSKEQFHLPTQRELAEYKIATRRTYEYIKSMGERQKEAISNYVSEEELKYLVDKRHQEEVKTIKEKIDDGVLRRSSVQKITSNIASQLNDWQRDWGRIVETECQNIYTLGSAQVIMKEHGVTSKVYFDVFPGACRHCIRLYLTGGIGSKPKIFTVQQLLDNGTNIGRKAADWEPVLGTVHRFCFINPCVKITTTEGLKDIADIIPGDIVLTHNNRFKRVKELIRHTVDTAVIFHVDYKIPKVVGNRTLRSITKDHPVLTTRGWVPVGGLSVWDKLIVEHTDNGVVALVEADVLRIYSELYEGQEILLYNFSVEEDESYIADGVVVHNCRCQLRYLPDGYIWDEEKQRFVAPEHTPTVSRTSRVKITVGDKDFYA